MKIVYSLILFLLLTVSYPLSTVTAQAASGATLQLNPSSGTLNRGCSYDVQIVLDTGGAQTDGTDAIFFFEITKFTSTTNDITKGTVYSEYLGNNVTDGRVFVSGIAPFTQPFSGKGVLATVKMTVKSDAPLGAAKLNFDFDIANKTKSTDSNVAKRGEGDILSAVTDGNFTIGTGTCASTGGTGTGSGTGTGTLPATGQGGQGSGSTTSGTAKGGTIDDITGNGKTTGTVEFTYMLTIIGFVLTILGIFGFAIL